MKHCLCVILLILSLFPLLAQVDSVQSREDGELKLSDKFRQELDNAFSFSPLVAPIEPDNSLTIEQLHEWVGKPDSTLSDTSRFTREYFALRIYDKEFCKPIPVSAQYSIYIPGITDHGFSKNLAPKAGLSKSFDFNVLGSYIRPKEIRLRKLRALADRSRAIMDKIFPSADLPFYSKEDIDTTMVSKMFKINTK